MIQKKRERYRKKENNNAESQQSRSRNSGIPETSRNNRIFSGVNYSNIINSNENNSIQGSSGTTNQRNNNQSINREESVDLIEKPKIL